MKDIRWDLAKSQELKKTRGVSFEEVLEAELIGIKEHPKKGHQSIMLFKHKNYVWVVPYVADDNKIFLKTLFPSRKYTKLWKEGKLQ